MPHLRTVLRATFAGFVSGIVILGVVGRFLMWAVAVALHGSGGFTFGGSLEVLIAGALFGTIGGLIFSFVPERLGQWRSVIHTIVLFTFIALVSDAARSAASSITWPMRVPVLLAFAGLLFGYSLFVIYLSHTPRDSGLRASE